MSIFQIFTDQFRIALITKFMKDKEEDPISFDEKGHIDVEEINFSETENGRTVINLQ